MFVRKKHNRSGTVSIVVVDKHHGAYKEVRVIGTSSEESEVMEFVRQGQDWIRQQNVQLDMFAQQEREKAEQETMEYFFNNIENVLLNGPQLPLYCLLPDCSLVIV